MPDLLPDFIFEDKSSDARSQTPCQIEPQDDFRPLAIAASENVKGAPSKSIRIQNVADSDDDHVISKRRYLSLFLVCLFLLTFM